MTGVLKCLFENTFTDGDDHEAEQPTVKVLAIADDNDVDAGGPRWVTQRRCKCGQMRIEVSGD